MQLSFSDGWNICCLPTKMMMTRTKQYSKNHSLAGWKWWTYCGQFQSPFFIGISAASTLLGPSALHFRHRIFLEKFMKLHLQQNAKDISYQTSKYKWLVWMQPFDVVIQWEAKKGEVGGWWYWTTLRWLPTIK